MFGTILICLVRFEGRYVDIGEGFGIFTGVVIIVASIEGISKIVVSVRRFAKAPTLLFFDYGILNSNSNVSSMWPFGCIFDVRMFIMT